VPNILAQTIGSATSADFTISGSTTYTLSTASGVLSPNVYAEIQYKNASGAYTTFTTLEANKPLHVTSATGTFRVVKWGGSSAFGVDYVSASGSGGAAAAATLPAGTNRSGSITTGGTAQVLAAANPARVSLTAQNISTTDLWVNETGGTAAASTAGSFRVVAGGAFSVSTNQAISVFGATTGQTWTATEA
jgi:hypothetical protein